MKIVDSSAEGVIDMNESIDRQVYLRLQKVAVHPLGSLASDNLYPIKQFIETFNGISDGTIANNEANNFLGKLGTTHRYPHRDNTYKGELQ